MMTVDYEPGNLVDVERVSRAMDFMIEESNRKQTTFKILKYKVHGISLILPSETN